MSTVHQLQQFRLIEKFERELGEQARAGSRRPRSDRFNR